ncbi:SusE domain-containing protein [Spirosoma rhododendri]|uniref:SusF/SusE family outer membrane protein n=1 Tax=Spirosoma rhododendri TaxID=2728024 RepID=A0A7L5DH02_9BACT|nr:SusE domain-containing protein [Spirosoma rhododendri]QJD77509.1 SusF/SusE family outer membrane protein [Spirosoma rhododendri]
MKFWLNSILLIGLGLAGLSACEKPDDRVVLQPSGTVTLTSNATSLSLSADQSTQNAVTFTWTPAQYGYQAATLYTVQLDKVGNNFAAPVEISAGNSTSAVVTVADLNQNLLRLGLPAGSAGQVEARVRAELVLNGTTAATTMPTYSASTTLTGTPYLVVIYYPSIYVPGAYQGWAPDQAPKLSSVTNNKIYEGYINFPGASEFKLTSVPAWSGTNYGAGAAGKLSAEGSAGNLSVTTPGYYLLKADLNALTYTLTPTTWSVIGAATPKGWDADTPLTYDATTGTWRGTVALTKDVLKFRANGAWDINYGDTSADGLLDLNGDNISVPSAGTYTVILDLSKPGNYTYRLIRQ